MDAESFYDKLLASIGPVRDPCDDKKPETLFHKDPSTTTKPSDDCHRVPASIDIQSIPTNEVLDKQLPLKGSPQEQYTSPVAPPTSSGQKSCDTFTPATNSCHKTTPTDSAAVAPNNSAKLEAELRARLLASSKKRKTSIPPPRPPPLAPSKRPPRGSPVFTTVPLSTSTPNNGDDPTPQSSSATIAQSPVSEPVPAAEQRGPSPQSLLQPQGKLALPPKPRQREGFRLRIKLPFSFLPSMFTIVETERFPLTTPISAILDLFNRRSVQDYLYFPSSPSSIPVLSANTHNGCEPEDPGGSGLGSGLGLELELGRDVEVDVGQRFYRDIPRVSDQRQTGWREAPTARGGSIRDANSRNLRATLEDVVTVAGAEWVECELRSDPRPKSSHSTNNGNMENKFRGFYEEKETNEQWHEQTGGGSSDDMVWQVSPAMEQWDYSDPLVLHHQQQQQHHHQHQQHQQQHPQWGAAWQGQYPSYNSPWFHCNEYQTPVPPSQDISSDGDAQRWIPGHRDYDSAGWTYGFQHQNQNSKQGEGENPSGPSILSSIPVQISQHTPEIHPQNRPESPAGKDVIIEPQLSQMPTGPSLTSQSGRSNNPVATDSKKARKRGAFSTKSGAMRRKKARESQGRVRNGGSGGGSGNRGGNGGGSIGPAALPLALAGAVPGGFGAAGGDGDSGSRPG
jgi:hypothetical protein